MRLACRLLAAILPPTGAGRSTLGDLIEEYHRRPRGPWRHLWFWGIAIDLIARYLPGRVSGLFGGFGRDFVYATRLSRRFPALVLAAGLSLSLTIGVGTGAFSVANGTLLRFQRAQDPSIVKIWRRHEHGASMTWPLSELAQLREQARQVTIEGVLPSTESIGSSVTSAAQDTATVAFVTGGYLSMLNAGLNIGRLLNLADDRPGAMPVVVLDHLYWGRHYGADHTVLGRIVSIRGTDFMVVGVASRDFIDPSGRRPSMWVPFACVDRMATTGTELGTPKAWAIGRLSRGTTVRQANTELTSLLAGIAPAAMPPQATGIEVVPATSDDETTIIRGALIGVLTLIALVLVLACANVSNLQLCGAAERRQEMAIRLACGASRRRLVRQLVTESVLLSTAAGAIGLLLANVLSPVLAAGIGMQDADVAPDLRVYAFVVIASAISAIGTGLAPAYYSARSNVSTDLNGSGSRDGAHARPSRAKAIFIGIQASASTVLVALAALQVRALVHMAWTDPGFDVSRVLSVATEFSRTPEGNARAGAFWPRAIERVRSIPGVERAALATFIPFTIRLGDPAAVAEDGTDADYFATMGVRLVRGRSYTAAEVAAHERVAVISEALAHRFWGVEDALGTSASRIDAKYVGVQVIGVAADTLVESVARRTLMVYVPFVSDGYAQMAVRTRDPGAMAGAVREAVGNVAPDMRPTVTVIADAYQREFEQPRRYAALAGSVALFALVLSVVGLFGVTSFAVRTRRREIGIRLALGARAGDVMGLLVLEGMRPVIVGLMVGLAGALIVGRVAAGLLYGLSERDPLALAVTVIVLLMAAGGAVVMPTRRAARLDPTLVLRNS
jgi:predicted permease